MSLFVTRSFQVRNANQPQGTREKLKILALCAVAGLTASVGMGRPTPPIVKPGQVVHTFEASNDLGDVVVTVVDTTANGLSGASYGTNFLAPIFWNQAAPNTARTNEWTVQNLGQVFGVTLDNAPNPNIYVTAASSKYIYPYVAAGWAFGPMLAGGVYRLDGTTGAICPMVGLPNDPIGPTAAGLGNVTFSALTNSLYVSNFADGLIYRIPLGTNLNAPVCPVPRGSMTTYDHGITGRMSAGYSPIIDDGLPGITAYGRRVWGLCVNPSENRLYYGVWWEDTVNQNPNQNNEVWSIALNAAGDPTGAARLEISLPNSMGTYGNPAAGLNFSPSGTLLVGERTFGPGATSSQNRAHESYLLEYVGATGAWVQQPASKYYVGINGRSNGGTPQVDQLDRVWTSGDGIVFNYTNPQGVWENDYGLLRMPAGGNGTAADVNTAQQYRTARSIVIDSDRNVGPYDKTEIGSLVIRKDCTPPPAGMVLWMPFDQTTGPSAMNYDGAVGTLGGGAYWGGAAKVSNGICFDAGRVDVPNYATLYLNGNLTIDAWVNPWAQAGLWKHTIVDKREWINATTWRGYWFYIDQAGTTGTLKLQMNDGVGAAKVASGPVVLMNTTWQFVAVTAARTCGGVSGQICVEFNYNGVRSTVPAITGETGTMGTTHGVRIGDDLDSTTSDGWLVGCLDELEIFNRDLSTAELNKIFNAGPLGKCKQLVWRCPSDFNRDDAIDFFDYLDFVDAFSAGDLSSDFNNDYNLDFFDYLDFVDAFSGGC